MDLDPSILCSATKRDGTPCGNKHLRGSKVCRKHGANLPNNRKNASANLVRGQLAQFVTPIASDDWEAHPIAALEMDVRRTVGRIRYLDEQIALLTPESLIWGKTKEENISATEFAGTNTTYESKVNILYTIQMEERKHLLALERVWIGAKLDAGRLELQKQAVERLDTAIVRILTRAGLDINDPDLRQSVREEMLAIAAG